MANTKISALTALTGANLATDDVFPVVDTSATATKSITVAELKLGIMPAPGPIGGTTPSTGAFTSVSATAGATIVSTVGAGGMSVKNITSNLPTIVLGSTDTPNVDIAFQNHTGTLIIQDGFGITRVAISSTGLAVTGTISATGIVTPGTFTTGTRPAKTLGGIIFDTTLNKLLIGGVSAWEVVTSI